MQNTMLDSTTSCIPSTLNFVCDVNGEHTELVNRYHMEACNRYRQCEESLRVTNIEIADVF